MTTTAHATPTRARVAPTAAFAAEWSKLFSLRGTRRTLVASLVLAVAVAALLCAAIETTTGVPLERTPVLDVVTASMLAVDATALLVLVMASGLVGSEYANGMIRTTLTAVPGRTRLLLSRAAVLAVVGYAVGVLSALLALATGQAILLAAGLPVASPADPAILRLVLGVAVEVPVYGLFGMAFAFVFRATGGGIVTALVVVFLPTVLDWLRDYLPGELITYMPNPAIHNVAGLTAPADATHLSAGAAALTLVVWVGAALALADRLLAARDA
jgi:ABC-2 type transport system permease protein